TCLSPADSGSNATQSDTGEKNARLTSFNPFASYSHQSSKSHSNRRTLSNSSPRSTQVSNMSRSNESSPIISGNHVRLAAHPVIVADRHADGTPIVTLRKNGDLIMEIQIRCPCGELIVLDC